MRLRSRERGLRGVAAGLATAALALFAAAPALAGQVGQAAPVTAPKTAPPIVAAAAAPLPAVSSQPPLDVDRDPSPSPDPDPAPQPIGNTPPAPIDKIARAAGGKYTLRENAYEVRLNASVFDQTGRSVETLGKEAFHSSGSMYDKRAAVEQASLDLVKLSNPEDEAFLVDFSYEAFIDQDFTSDINKLQQGLSYIKSSGGTAIYDALVASADYLSKNAKHPKQVLLVVTDGEDNASSATLEAAIRRIQEFDGPVIYSIGLLFGDDANKGEVRTARRVLETLSEETGGQAYFPKSVKEVDAIAKEVANDIRTQYTIAYHSTKSPALGGYRQVRVEAREKGYSKLSVRTRTGYYPRVDTASAQADPGAPSP